MKKHEGKHITKTEDESDASIGRYAAYLSVFLAQHPGYTTSHSLRQAPQGGPYVNQTIVEIHCLLTDSPVNVLRPLLGLMRVHVIRLVTNARRVRLVVDTSYMSRSTLFTHQHRNRF